MKLHFATHVLMSSLAVVAAKDNANTGLIQFGNDALCSVLVVHKAAQEDGYQVTITKPQANAKVLNQQSKSYHTWHPLHVGKGEFVFKYAELENAYLGFDSDMKTFRILQKSDSSHEQLPKWTLIEQQQKGLYLISPDDGYSCLAIADDNSIFQLPCSLLDTETSLRPLKLSVDRDIKDISSPLRFLKEKKLKKPKKGKNKMKKNKNKKGSKKQTTTPSTTPSLNPTTDPTVTPSFLPTTLPSATPSSTPSLIPTDSSSLIPSSTPSSVSSIYPSISPSIHDSSLPSISIRDSSLPSLFPSSGPSNNPTISPSILPSQRPSFNPSNMPSDIPSIVPTNAPSLLPSLLPSTAPSEVPSISPTRYCNDEAALTSFYTNLDGANWSNNNNWPSGNFCSWEFVTCDSSGTYVTSFSLDYNGATGTLPSEMGNFCSIQTLFLQEYSFFGSIPFQEFIELSDTLKNVALLVHSGNYLSGTIPTEIGLLSNIEYLSLEWLTSNTGSLPTELGSLEKLYHLNLDDNFLTGNIPSEIGALSSLTFLSLDDNTLAGSIPSELGRLSSLTSLILSSNSLSGSIPSELALLTSLTSFDLSSNSLQGSVPSEICASGITLIATNNPALTPC